MTQPTDAISLIQSARASIDTPQAGDAEGLLANAVRLLQQSAEPAGDSQTARLRQLVALCRAAIEAERDYELARLARDTHRCNLVSYVDLLETAL